MIAESPQVRLRWLVERDNSRRAGSVATVLTAVVAMLVMVVGIRAVACREGPAEALKGGS